METHLAHRLKVLQASGVDGGQITTRKGGHEDIVGLGGGVACRSVRDLEAAVGISDQLYCLTLESDADIRIVLESEGRACHTSGGTGFDDLDRSSRGQREERDESDDLETHSERGVSEKQGLKLEEGANRIRTGRVGF